MPAARYYLKLSFSSIALNYAIAWACVLWSPDTRSTMPPADTEQRPLDEWWEPPKIVGPDGGEGWWATSEGIGVWDAVPQRFRMSDSVGFLYWRRTGTPSYFRSGWPMLSLQSSVTIEDGRSGWSLPFTELIRRGIPTNRLPLWLHAQAERRLPLLPLFPGFVGNTAMLFGVLVAFSRVAASFNKALENRKLLSVEVISGLQTNS